MALPILPGLYVIAAYVGSRPSFALLRPHFLQKWIRPLPLTLMLTSVPFLDHVAGWRNVANGEHEAVLELQEEISNPIENIILVTSDERSDKSLAFYFGYQYPKNLLVRYLPNIEEISADTDRILLFVNAERSQFLNKAYGNRHFDDEIRALGLPTAYASESIQLFRAENPTEKRLIANLLRRLTKRAAPK